MSPARSFCRSNCRLSCAVWFLRIVNLFSSESVIVPSFSFCSNLSFSSLRALSSFLVSLTSDLACLNSFVILVSLALLPMSTYFARATDASPKAATKPAEPSKLPLSRVNTLDSLPAPLLVTFLIVPCIALNAPPALSAPLAASPRAPPSLPNNLTIESPLSPKAALAIKLNPVAIAVPHITTCPASLDKNSKAPVRISMPFLRASLLIILYDNSSHARFKFCK